MRDEHGSGIGGVIARLREQQGWSQRELARSVGLDQSAVSRIEAGRRRVSAVELQRFADLFNVSADTLLHERETGGVTGTSWTTALQPAPGRGPTPDASMQDEGGQLAAVRHATAALPAHARLGGKPTAFEDHEPPPASVGAMALHEAFVPGDAGADEGDLWRAYRQAVRPSAGAVWSAGPPLATVVGPTDEAAEAPAAGATAASPDAGGWTPTVAAVVRDWFALRAHADRPASAVPWSTGQTAQGTPSFSPRPWRPPAAAGPGEALYDRVARFWRSELHVDPDDGPLPDLVPLLEDGLGIQVIVARVAAGADDAPQPQSAAGTVSGWAGTESASALHPVAASFVAGGVPFVFVNAARPVVLQRFALAHSLAHLMLAHGDVVDERIGWSRANPREAAANDFAEEFLAPVRAVERWYARRADLSRGASLDTLLQLANAFGISAWAALFRTRAAGRLTARQFSALRREMRGHDWQLLPRQAFLGGVRDTLAHLTPQEVLPPGAFGEPAVLRVPAPMRAWAWAALRDGRLSLEEAARALCLRPGALAEQLARLGLE